MPRPPFLLRPHTAEAAVAASGASFGALCVNAARGLRALWGLGAGAPRRVEPLEFAGGTPEELLVAWLEEVVFRLSARGEVLASARASGGAGRPLRVRAGWRPLAPGERPRLEVKAATYHGLRVRRRAGRWTAAVVFDV